MELLFVPFEYPVMDVAIEYPVMGIVERVFISILDVF